jgi:gamma-glutamyltranspeptidase/glutathione hydrolase
VAVAAALNVTEPCSTGIGGDMFLIFYDAKTKTVRSLNGSGRSPKNGSLQFIRQTLGIPDDQAGSIPTTSVHSVTVPGAAAGWCDTVERFGNQKLSLAEILAPAVRLAENGHPVSQITASAWQRSEKRIKEASPNGHEMLKADSKAPGGYRAPRCGEIFKSPTLANTFRILAKEGKKGFYTGPVAQDMVQVSADQGGKLTLEDFAHHCEAGTEETKPIALRFTAFGVNAERGGIDMWEHPPNGQGIVALMALGMIQELEKAGKIKRWQSQEHNSVSYLHVLIETLRIAFADAHKFVADPSTVPVPVDGMLSPEYLASRAQLMTLERAIPSSELTHGSPMPFSKSDTVYFTVVDGEGNAASFINSNYAGFGTAIIPPGRGFTLQNRGANFSLVKGHANEYAPMKRPYHTIIPALVTHADTGELKTSFGVMGGFMQPQGHVQVLLNSEVFGMDPQEALDAPRFCIGEGMPNPDGSVSLSTVNLEEGISSGVVEGLRALGHQVDVLGDEARAMFGRGQVVSLTKDDGQMVFSAGSDMRADGNAAAVV